MLENHWTKQDDQILTYLIIQKQIHSWNLVSKIMQTDYNTQPHTPQQCQSRWYNVLYSTVTLQEWSQSQQKKLTYYHNLYGNKWSKISLFLPGRSDNSVKNHFYSTLRKAFRGLNKYISQNKKQSQIKPFNNLALSRIISLAEQAIQKKLYNILNIQSQDVYIYMKAFELKNRLMRYGNLLDNNGNEVFETEYILKSIVLVSKLYRSQKIKRRKKHNRIGNILQKESDLQKQTIVKLEQNVKEQERLEQMIKVEQKEQQNEEMLKNRGLNNSSYFYYYPTQQQIQNLKNYYYAISQNLQYKNTNLQIPIKIQTTQINH